MGDKSYLHSLMGGVAVPFLQALITGVFACVVAAGVGWMLHVRVGVALLLGGGVAAAVCWAYLLHHWIELTSPPTIPEYSIIDDAQPERMPEVRVELKTSERQLIFIDLPAKPEQLSALARGLLDGAPFSESHWTGSRGCFTRSEFAQLRTVLIQRGLLQWRNEEYTSCGCQLTSPGRAVLRHFLDIPTPPRLLE